jgi:L-xylulokinase
MGNGSPLLLGLDAGNTVVKAVLFDISGNEIAQSRRNCASVHPKPGHVERSMAELWSAVCDVIHECLAKAIARPGDIAAVGCAGHGNGLYLLDRAGAPLHAIQSLDSRAASIAETLCGDGNGRKLHAICLQEPWPAQTAALLAWIRAHAPDIYTRVGTAFMCKDFITFCLTGRRVADISDLSAAGLVRMPECVYDDELLERYGLAGAKSLLPDIVKPTEVVGHITAEAAAATGLRQGTAVVGGLFDVVASAVGSGAVEEGQASIIIGTWSINQLISNRAIADPNVFMVSAFADERFVSIESSATSAANLEWYARELVKVVDRDKDIFGECNWRASQVLPARDDPFFHPFLYGSRQGASFRAGFNGIAGWHTEGHMLRALFEGVTFEHRRHIDVLRDSGLKFVSAKLAGGGARSSFWRQMFADVLAIPISVTKCDETGALGAAIAAGVGVGIFADFADGVHKTVHEGADHTPDFSMSAHYARRYDIYLQLIEAMKPVWNRMAGRADP